jgi:hypothetical protein
VASIAKRAIRGRTAAAKGKRCLAGQVVFVAVGVNHFDHPGWILDAQGAVRTHGNRYLGHEISCE